MKKILLKLFVCIVVGTFITVGVLNVVENFLYKITQSSYLEVQTYRN